jgi:5-(carboxyamino)imidazole ribonucleotide mutase
MTERTDPRVGIVGGSRSDFPVLEKAAALLTELGVANELRVVSAHRTPDLLYRYAEEAAGPPTCRACWPPRRSCP